MSTPRLHVPGTAVRKQDVNVFVCSTCGNEFRYDDDYEPVCTGPGWLDEHEPTVMVLVRVEAAKGALWTPTGSTS